MLDSFQRADFIQHFKKEEKNRVGWCWMNFLASNTKNNIQFPAPFRILILMFLSVRTSIRMFLLKITRGGQLI